MISRNIGLQFVILIGSCLKVSKNIYRYFVYFWNIEMKYYFQAAILIASRWGLKFFQ